LFFEVKDWLLKRAGDSAGNLHIARSCNDMGVIAFFGIRGCAGRIMMLHNTPYGDIVDTEDDAQTCLWRAISKIERIYGLLENVISTVYVDVKLCSRHLACGHACRGGVHSI